MDKGLLRVMCNHQVAEGIYRIRLAGGLVQEMKQPGQFVHVKCGTGIDPLLRRPISICDVNVVEGYMDMIYRVEGAGTKLLSQAVPETQIDVLGPLGHGFPVAHRKACEHALLVGGGVGVPPLLYLAKQLVDKGVKVTSVIGFGTAKQVFLQEELAALGEVHVVTMDGSMGRKGIVTDVLTADHGLSAEDWDVLYSCGPHPMLKALQERYQEKEAYISLEERMGCGVGACYACVCKPAETAGASYYKICSDGPVFPLQEVIL